MAGVGDFFSCGGASKLRDRFFSYNSINQSSAAYGEGWHTGRDIALGMALGGAGKLAGTAAGEFAAARGIIITENGLGHATARHTVEGARNAGKSVFAAGEDLAALVRSASDAPRIQQAGGNFERVVDAGRAIGVDRATGQSTSIYTIITNAADHLITAFPGRP